MTPERWQRIDGLFQEALGRAPDERDAFLAEACGGDEELCAEVLSLLASHQNATQAFRPADLNNLFLDALGDGDEPPDAGRVGNYKLLGEVGRGGMGVVYLAERDDDAYRKRVAVKIIKRGLDTDFVLRRFRTERQILSDFDHPNIARLLDGGTTPAGLPFFVMEYIEGEPINDYCDRKGLAVAERLALFRQVCSAVQYAHQRLVIHRDIKPSNILVDGAGVPKLLDFGIAKLLSGEGHDDQTETLPMMRMMTPEYASPEQLRGERITTASDVYSLGILLFELLTGQRPYRFTSRSPLDIADLIANTDPERPSTAVCRGDQTRGNSTAAPQKGDSEHLSRILSGDLDNIILKAIRREKERRYASIEQFSEDIRRHLEGLPVLARKDTFRYRASKFVGRNRAAVIVASLLVITLLGGILATAWQARRARQQEAIARAEQAEAVRRFNDVRKLANLVVFDYYESIVALPGSTAVREKLVKDMLEYLNDLAQSDEGDPTLRLDLARAYEKISSVQGGSALSNLGDTPGAIESIRRALSIREDLLAEDPGNVGHRAGLAAAQARLAGLLSEAGDRAGTLDAYRKAVELAESAVAAEPTDAAYRRLLATSSGDYGDALTSEGDWPAALRYSRKSLGIYEALLAEDPGNVANRRSLSAAHQNIAAILLYTGDPAEALAYQRKAVEIVKSLADEHPTSTDFKGLLSANYYYLGTVQYYFAKARGEKAYLAESLESYRRAAQLNEELAAADPKDASQRAFHAHLYVGMILEEMGEYGEAVALYRKVASSREEMYRSDPSNTFKQWLVIEVSARTARGLAKGGDRGAALSLCQRALTLIAGSAAAALTAEYETAKAIAYTDVAAAYAALARHPGGAKQERREHLLAARDCYRRALDIYLALKNQGRLSATEGVMIDEVRRELARCEAALG